MSYGDRRTTIGACSEGIEHDAMAEIHPSEASGVREMITGAREMKISAREMLNVAQEMVIGAREMTIACTQWELALEK